MFLGSETGVMRGHAEAVCGSAEKIASIVDSLRASTAATVWAGEDRDVFDERARGTFVAAADVAGTLQQFATMLTTEARQQDAVSSAAPPGGDDTATMLANGQRDQGDPSVTDTMRPPVPYARTEAEAEENIGSRGVDQGSVNDCWFLSALMGVAEHDPNYIRDHMRRNADGTWTVTLYKDGDPVEIVVESEFSPDAAGHRVPRRDGHGDVIIGPDGEPEMVTVTGGWPAIYEKASAEYRSTYGDSGYEQLGYGWGEEGYEMLTPGDVERTGQSGFDDIRERFENGPVSVATEHPEDARLYAYWEGRIDDPTVVPRHEYNVAGFIAAGEKAPDGSIAAQDRIHLENPWGPGGGSFGGTERTGDLYMTEDEYKDNFRGVSSVDLGR